MVYFCQSQSKSHHQIRTPDVEPGVFVCLWRKKNPINKVGYLFLLWKCNEVPNSILSFSHLTLAIQRTIVESIWGLIADISDCPTIAVTQSAEYGTFTSLNEGHCLSTRDSDIFVSVIPIVLVVLAILDVIVEAHFYGNIFTIPVF